MDNNILIKYILVSIILYGILSSIDTQNRNIIFIFMLINFIFYNKEFVLRKINLNQDIEINNYDFNPIFLKLKDYKNFNINSYNLIVKNLEKFLKIYDSVNDNKYISEDIVNAYDLKNNIISTLEQLLINIPTKENIDIEHNFYDIKNDLKLLLSKYVKKIVKINNKNWKKNTNNIQKPIFINHPKPFNY